MPREYAVRVGRLVEVSFGLPHEKPEVVTRKFERARRWLLSRGGLYASIHARCGMRRVAS
jgi:hypothetical protein